MTSQKLGFRSGSHKGRDECGLEWPKKMVTHRRWTLQNKWCATVTKTKSVCCPPCDWATCGKAIDLRGWKDGNPHYTIAKHSKLSLPLKLVALREIAGKSQNISVCYLLLPAFNKG